MIARHKLIEGAIGTFPEEDKAYWKVKTFSWLLPVIAIIGAIIDAIFVWIYMRFAHPWKDLLFLKEKEKSTKIPKSKKPSAMKRHFPPDFI